MPYSIKGFGNIKKYKKALFSYVQSLLDNVVNFG